MCVYIYIHVSVFSFFSVIVQGSRRTSYGNRSTFSFESPKEPLITTEQAPGLSSPIKSSFNGRRFSLRPTPNQAGISTGNAATTAKPLPRWKAGMLQRQIGQMNLRRRARAFSLSDVQPYNSKGTSEPFTLSSNIYKRYNRDPIRKNVFMHQVSNDGKPVSRAVESTDQFIFPTRRSDERNSSFLRETSCTDNTYDPYVQPTLNTISDNTIDPSNESTSLATATDTPVVQVTDNKTVGHNTKKEPSSSSSIRYLPKTNTESSQQSLVEVKVENPDVKNTV